MVSFLARIFIKDYKNTGSPQVRQAYGMLCGSVGIGLNILLFIGKIHCRDPERIHCHYCRRGKQPVRRRLFFYHSDRL